MKKNVFSALLFMIKFKQLLLGSIFLFSVLAVQAQVTTASLGGRITDLNNETLLGVTIQVIHEPSGTSYGTVTNSDGRYSIQGMRTGGPYKVTASYIGFQTAVYKDITLQLGETYKLDMKLNESTELLNEVVVVASRSAFSAEKTGATTNISSTQMSQLPTINRSISEIARLSPYANGMSFAGGDGRSTNFTIDGANFNNNFGLSSSLPGGGNPVSMDAIDEIQIVIAPYDVRQTNFIGGGINAVTKSGTNTFKGTAYTYQYTDNMRGSRIDSESLNVPKNNDRQIYGATFGGPIVKNKLFFFANMEYQKIPSTIIDWRASEDGVAVPDSYVSATKLSDMKKVSEFVKQKYGYDTGSYTDYPADETNWKILGRIDWNINSRHKLALRYNYTKNAAWNPTNGNSSDTGFRLRNKDRFSQYSMAFANSCYSMDNKVTSFSADLNSRFSDVTSNQLLVTYSDIQDIRGTNSSPFPFIDIMAGYDASTGIQTLDPYISLGYELFTYNNAVKNKVLTITDNFTYYKGTHKITAGLSYERQMANNAYMRNGTGYYRYRSIDDFLNGAAPEAFALTYGYNGETNPTAEVLFHQIGLYAQDDWSISPNLKLNYGFRLDNIRFDESSIMTNNAIKAYDFGGRHIDTGKWPGSNIQVSPRIGFVWNVLGDKSLKVRGGTGLFSGRLPLVFFTNMPTNSGMIQNSVTNINTKYNSDGTVASRDPRLDKLSGGLVTDVNKMIEVLGLPTTITPDKGVAPSSLAGVDPDFKMPQVWKSSIAVDYQLPVSFPLTVSGEFMYTKNINAVCLDNYNIKPIGKDWERFAGADNRVIYPKDHLYYKDISNACVLTNTSKGYGYTANLTVNAQPIPELNLMASYTHTESKEVSGMPGSNANSAWQGLYTIDGPNFAEVQRSQYVVPDRVIASLNYTADHCTEGFDTQISLFYSGYSPAGYSYYYSNDMNGDGISGDLMYIPKDDSEIRFKNENDRVDFWNYVNQDSYLKKHKGEYAEAYSARAPWIHRFDFRISQDFAVKVGKSVNKLQISFDFMNIGNMFNSCWGVSKNMANSNYGAILKYEGRDASNQPQFSLWRDREGNAPTKTYSYNKNYNECWHLQIGIRYLFN